jgi:ATP-dependent DNA ligase
MKKIFPTLYEKSTTGKIKYWKISVSGTKQEATITVKYGADEDKERISEKLITEGKNIGKKNETTPYEQACAEAESTWKKKLDSGYIEDQANLDKEVLLPMLAHRFQERKHDIIYPAFAQPKLDGVRCLAKKIDKKTIKYYSRMGKEYTTLEHLTPDLLKMMDIDEVYDGEIYTHDYTFQEMVSFVKKQRPETTQLKFYVFDIAEVGPDFQIRHQKLTRDFLKIIKTAAKGEPFNFSPIILVSNREVKSEKDVYEYHDLFVKDGNEGVIIRNKRGLYDFKNRSKNLQKYKEFKDEEFEITGGYEGTGTEAGCITFTCKGKSGEEFSVRPRGSFEQRKQWMHDIKKIIGKSLTVRYQELTDGGVPRFPVGIAIREDYE